MSGAATARRVSWGFADQALSSLSNFALGVLVARTVSQDDFGAFSVAFTTYTVALITSRALASEPFMIRHSTGSRDDWRAATAGSSGMAILVGLLGSALIAIVGLSQGGALGLALLALAVVLPGLLAQDMWRFAFIAHGRAKDAFALDLAWLLLLVPALLELEAIGSDSIGWPILAWGATGGITAVGAHLGARSRPAFRAARAWWVAHRDIGPRYVVEALVSLGAIQGSTYALVLLSGLAAAGALRGGQLLIGPMQVLLIGVSITAVPEGVRWMRRRGVASLRRPALAISLMVGLTTFAWAAMVSLLPDPLGVLLLGETWASAKSLILPLGLAYGIGALGLGAGVGMRVLADARRSVRARSVDATAQAVGGIIGASQAGALGMAYGLASGAIVGAAANWLGFLAAVREAERDPSLVPGGPPSGT